MEVIRKGDELQITVKLGSNAERIQAMLDYLEFQELTSKTDVPQEEVDKLINEAKKGRWERTKARRGLK